MMRMLSESGPVGGETSLPAVHEVELPVVSNQLVAGEYRKLVLAAPRDLLTTCRAGQFFHLLCPAREGASPYLRRPMSIYAFDRDREELHFLYKVTGIGTQALARLKSGNRLNVLGPLGNGFTVRPGWQRLLLLARGVGLATLAPLALEAHRLGRHLTAICSARSADLLMSLDYFRDLGAEVIAVTDDDGTSSMDNVEAIIRRAIARDGVDASYTCGSSRMLALLQKLAEEHGIPGEVALEQQMACGLGMCHCCVRPFRRDGRTVHLRVCREGPVFPLEEATTWSI